MYAGSVVVATLFFVPLQGFLPRCAGLLVLAECDTGVAEIVENAGGVVSVAEFAKQREGSVVVGDGLDVVSGVVFDVAEAVQRGAFSLAMVVAPVQSERLMAVVASGVVIAEAGGVPAYGVERISFPNWLVEAAEKVQGPAGTGKGFPIVSR